MKIKTMIVLAALVCGLLMVSGGVWAMSSDNYAINWDAIGGGGEYASSTDYALRSTIGQAVAESSVSTNYKLWSGYWYPCGINDPPVANDDAYIADKDTTLNVAAPGVLANDSDPEGDTLSAIKVTDPSHGTLTLNSDGSFTYTPEADFCGPDTFTYKANDGELDSNIATVTIAVYAPWDVVMDWLINIKDVQQVGNHWLEEGEKGWIREDVNDDGAINMMDVIEIGNHWGE